MEIPHQLILGTILGYFVGTVWESLTHQYVYHAGTTLRALWKKNEVIYKVMTRGFFQHAIVHHGMTFKKDYITQFRSEQEREALDAILPPELADSIRLEGYGLTPHKLSLLFYSVQAVAAVPIGLLIGPWAAVVSVPIMISGMFMARFVHVYLHMPHAQALRIAPPLTAWFLKTRYARFIARYHYLHHKYTHCNYNLFFGGDILFGKVRKPSSKDLETMRTVGLPVD